MISPAVLAERGVRVLTRPWGHVAFTYAQRNGADFRFELQLWLQTPAGVAWLATREPPWL